MSLVGFFEWARYKPSCEGLMDITYSIYMSRLLEKPTMWFQTRSDTNQAVQPQKQARSLKFRI